jgi:hypothetical protein
MLHAELIALQRTFGIKIKQIHELNPLPTEEEILLLDQILPPTMYEQWELDLVNTHLLRLWQMLLIPELENAYESLKVRTAVISLNFKYDRYLKEIIEIIDSEEIREGEVLSPNSTPLPRAHSIAANSLSKTKHYSSTSLSGRPSLYHRNYEDNKNSKALSMISGGLTCCNPKASEITASKSPTVALADITLPASLVNNYINGKQQKGEKGVSCCIIL